MAQKKYPKDLLVDFYMVAYRIRVFETECIKLYRQGLVKGYFHPYLGQEAIATGVCAALDKGDYIASNHRGHGHCIARGASIKKMIAELMQKETGYCRGLGGSMHISDVSVGNLGANGIVGAGSPIGVGAALAAQLDGKNRVSVTFSSDGAANNGTFLESLNLAAIWNLPFILMVENNQFAVSTPIEESTREPDLYKRGPSIGVESHCVDGNDILAVYELTKKAVATCRNGKGPVLIEAKTFRHTGHHVNDPGTYMPKEKVEFYKAKDPVHAARALLSELAGMSEEQILLIENEIHAEFEEAVEFAKNSPELSLEKFKEFVAAY